MVTREPNHETAILGGGCFWCTEAVFQEVRGVVAVEPGYAGGETADPTYQEVCSGVTGHAEVVRIAYDPAVVSFRALLEIFFTVHDPTTPDRQGADVGPAYRSIILYRTPAEREAALANIEALDREGVFEAPIVTEVVPLEAFWPAEPGHRDYYRRNSGVPYCRVVIAPKLARLRAKHRHRLVARG